jgi:hypothetical protein
MRSRNVRGEAVGVDRRGVDPHVRGLMPLPPPFSSRTIWIIDVKQQRI